MTTSRRSAASSISGCFATSSRSRRTCTSQLPRHGCSLRSRRSAGTSAAGAPDRSPAVHADHAPCRADAGGRTAAWNARASCSRVHDRIWRELHAAERSARSSSTSSAKDGSQVPRILDTARATAPGLEFRGRFGGGVGPALERLRIGEIDVALGRDSIGSTSAQSTTSTPAHPPGAARRAATGRAPACGAARRSRSPRCADRSSMPTRQRHACARMGRPRAPVPGADRGPVDAATPAGHRARGAGLPPRPPGPADPDRRRSRGCARRGRPRSSSTRYRSTRGRWPGCGAEPAARQRHAPGRDRRLAVRRRRLAWLPATSQAATTGSRSPRPRR